MTLRPLKTEQQYDELLQWLDEQFDRQVPPDSEAGEQVQIALLLIKAYEDEHYVIPVSDPIAAIQLKMSEQGLKAKDLVGEIGSKSYVSAILNRRKPLTLAMARYFHQKLHIPASVLLA
jgi:HTH-type transcriptional regulator/antitoxin HigA